MTSKLSAGVTRAASLELLQGLELYSNCSNSRKARDLFSNSSSPEFKQELSYCVEGRAMLHKSNSEKMGVGGVSFREREAYVHRHE